MSLLFYCSRRRRSLAPRSGDRSDCRPHCAADSTRAGAVRSRLRDHAERSGCSRPAPRRGVRRIRSEQAARASGSLPSSCCARSRSLSLQQLLSIARINARTGEEQPRRPPVAQAHSSSCSTRTTGAGSRDSLPAVPARASARRRRLANVRQLFPERLRRRARDYEMPSTLPVSEVVFVNFDGEPGCGVGSPRILGSFRLIDTDDERISASPVPKHGARRPRATRTCRVLARPRDRDSARSVAGDTPCSPSRVSSISLGCRQLLTCKS